MQVGRSLASQQHPALEEPVVPVLVVLVFLGCWETLPRKRSFMGEQDITSPSTVACLSPPVSLLTSEHPVEKEALCFLGWQQDVHPRRINQTSPETHVQVEAETIEFVAWTPLLL